MSAVLVIAGCDSSGGAGLARDLSTLHEVGVPALCALTAVTAQTDAAVLASHGVPQAMLRAQIEAAFATRPVGAIKIGMLASAASVRTVAQCLRAHPQVPVVLDPVLMSSSGAVLLEEDGRTALLQELLPLVSLITPNIPEAALLLGQAPARDESERLGQARQLLERGAPAVLLKGGHAQGAQCVDLLCLRDRPPEPLSAVRLAASMRGSGCALASAIAAYLAQGVELRVACAQGKEHVLALLRRS